MNKHPHKKLIEKIDDISREKFGEALYFRPLAPDDETIALIANRTGEKKSVVAQKLIRLALQGKQYEFDDEGRQFSQLDWLVRQEKKRAQQDNARDARIERLEEHAREMERILKRTEDNSHFIKVFVTEIYGLQAICVTLLNQIFTRLVEYFSPVEIEKKNSLDFANRNILELVKHALSELEKISKHHHLVDDETGTEMLYLYTKLDLLKVRLLTTTAGTDSGQNNQ